MKKQNLSENAHHQLREVTDLLGWSSEDEPLKICSETFSELSKMKKSGCRIVIRNRDNETDLEINFKDQSLENAIGTTLKLLNERAHGNEIVTIYLDGSEKNLQLVFL